MSGRSSSALPRAKFSRFFRDGLSPRLPKVANVGLRASQANEVTMSRRTHRWDASHDWPSSATGPSDASLAVCSADFTNSFSFSVC